MLAAMQSSIGIDRVLHSSNAKTGRGGYRVKGEHRVVDVVFLERLGHAFTRQVSVIEAFQGSLPVSDVSKRGVCAVFGKQSKDGWAG